MGRHPVFRKLERQSHGSIPILPHEFVAGVGMAAMVALLLTSLKPWMGGFIAHPTIWGLFCGALLVLGLYIWRQADHDRVDYIAIRVKAWRARRGHYNPALPDPHRIPFDP